ncbi:MAG: hypothetical protein DRI93_03620 [Aquificota bacterium]|nr:MAG: hypothetical protein DRI93_03620 [Aquificota bacterium]
MKAYWETKRALVEEYLDLWVPSEETPPSRLHQAVRYSLFAGGKRIRPVLALVAAEVVGGEDVQALPVACGIEMIHTYSLIHDDLPAMDDDDFRRGKPTCHRVFGEALAILAGDALLTMAFQVMGDLSLYPPGVEPIRVLKAVKEVALAAGPLGMVGGQVVDLEMEGKAHQREAEEALEWIHTHKTARMIEVSLKAGALVAGGEGEVDVLEAYGRCIGLAFQVVDDILGCQGDREKLGKPVGRDVERGKLTYPALYGIEASLKRARDLVEEALDLLRPLGERAWFLRELGRYVVERDR